jgi:hypothetical protein
MAATKYAAAMNRSRGRKTDAPTRTTNGIATAANADTTKSGDGPWSAANGRAVGAARPPESSIAVSRSIAGGEPGCGALTGNNDLSCKRCQSPRLRPDAAARAEMWQASA